MFAFPYLKHKQSRSSLTGDDYFRKLKQVCGIGPPPMMTAAHSVAPDCTHLLLNAQTLGQLLTINRYKHFRTTKTQTILPFSLLMFTAQACTCALVFLWVGLEQHLNSEESKAELISFLIFLPLVPLPLFPVS